ncbi:N-acetylmuramoyl-L-alanine amidase [Rurimicrobium arvi]|uniref:N-acetylmuramoyl-L-alanine amidase n=1 Tax=Rurimicrobium arvi TaxID=2049916 RepID=A0ABP8MY82_9BACT
MIFSFFTWLLKTGICSGLFYAYYHVMLRQRRSFVFNRMYLIAATLCSAIIPLMQIPFFSSPAPAAVFPLLEPGASSLMQEHVDAAAKGVFPWQHYILPAYALVTFLLLMRILVQLFRVYRWKQTGHCVSFQGAVLVKTKHPGAPFSFMHLLFWPESLDTQSAEARCVLLHEQAHIDQKHSLDKLLMQLVCAVAWLNPFYWIIERQLQLQHEFLADEAAVAPADADAFARMLLLAGFGARQQHIVHHFTQSSVAKRLHMIRKSADKRLSFMHRVAPAMLALLTIVLFSFTSSRDTPRAGRKVTIVLDAGHGGVQDKGAVSSGGQSEKDLMLSLVQELNSLSAEYNITVVSTRSADEFVPLDTRVQRAAASGADMFISLHMDKTEGQGQYELGIAPKNVQYQQSRVAASALADRFQKDLQLPVTLTDQGRIRVLRDNKLPAVLLSCGNIGNPQHVTMMSDPAQRERFCRAILSGIVNYANSR